MHALTATRFFAAVLIVLHHSVGNFGITREMLHGAATGMGVSYFFVLSGFILTYVYPTLTEQRNVEKFIVARIARLWPLHVTTLFITILLFPHEFRIATFLANLFMIHGWIPDWNYFFSYNWLSWAISTELGFYLCFPVLIYGLDRNWRMKVSLAFGVILLFTYLCKDLPMGSSSQIGFLGFIMINPIGRLHEFMVGMVAALTYRKVVQCYRPTIITGTVVEIFSLISVLIILFYNYGNENYLYPKSALSQWFNQGGIACLLFGLFIFVIALQKGMLSRVLATRTLRLLGEISFSIFMIHQLILRWYLINLASKVDIPQKFAYVLFWLCIVLVSYLLWRFVEKPCRNYIVKFCGRRFFSQNSSGGKVIDLNTYWGGELSATTQKGTSLIWRRWIMSSMPFLLVVVMIISYFSLTSKEPSITLEPVPECLETVFGEKFALIGIKRIYSIREYVLELSWKSLQKQKLKYNIAVHVIDKNGNIKYNNDKPLQAAYHDIEIDAIWVEQIKIPTYQLNKAVAVAIGLYSEEIGLLNIDKGPRDWNDRRLLIPLSIP